MSHHLTDEDEIDSLMVRFREGHSRDRVRVIRRLRQLGPCAVGKLCWALRHHDPAVVTAAAKALGEIGDPRAIEPLVETLRSNLLGRSGKRQLWTGHLTWFFSLVGGACWAWVIFSGVEVTPLFLGCLLLSLLASQLRNSCERRSELRAACVEALGRIAEAAPSLELRGVLPDLHALSRDVLLQAPRTRETTREAVRRIEAATSEAHQLPLPAAPHSESAHTLPRPAEYTLDPDSATLPRVSRS